MQLNFTDSLPPFLTFFYDIRSYYEELTEVQRFKIIKHKGYNDKIRIDFLQYYGLLKELDDEQNKYLDLYDKIDGKNGFNNIKNRLDFKTKMYYNLADFILLATSHIYNKSKMADELHNEMDDHINKLETDKSGDYRTMKLQKSFDMAYKYIIKMKNYIDNLIDHLYPLKKF